jgi:hypothetical protein
MGNGGCNCNVENVKIISHSKIKIVKVNPNKQVYEDLNSSNILNIEKSAIFKFHNFNENLNEKNILKDSIDNENNMFVIKNEISLENNLDFYKKFSIGPFFLNSNENYYNLESNLKIKSNLVLDELLKILELHKVDFLIIEKENFQYFLSDSLIQKFLSYIEKNKKDKIYNLFSYLFNNTLRLCLYNIYLPSNILKNNVVIQQSVYFQKKSEEIKYYIEKDIVRTFPQNKIFSEISFTNNLTNFILEISTADQELSYVQGMNFMCAYILMSTGNNKDLSINLYSRILNLKSKIFNLKFREFLTTNFKLLYLFIAKFNEILSIHFKGKLCKIVSENEVSEFLWLSKWWQTLFTYNFDFKYVSKFWDLIIINGLDYILLLSLAIVEFLWEKIKKVKSLEEFLNLLNNFYNEKDVEFSNFFNFLINKVKSKEYKKYLNTK